MNTTLFSRPLVQALRISLAAVLLAGLALAPCPPPALAAGGFTDLGACGLPGLGWAAGRGLGAGDSGLGRP